MRAARIPTGIDSTTPMAVDTTPIATVCSAASNRSAPSAPKSGGIIRVKTSSDGPTQVNRDIGLISNTNSDAMVVHDEQAGEHEPHRRGHASDSTAPA